MSILVKLSSQVGDRSEGANRQVVVQCLEDPNLLDAIVAGLRSQEAALVGDCAEVLTQVAEQHPDWVAPHAAALAPLLNHKATRVRWEATHALALVALPAPAVIADLLPELAEKIRTDSSVIVRDYATDAIANYAATGKPAAERAYPLLKEALTAWEGKHAGHALRGLCNVATMAPALVDELRVIAADYSLAGKAVVRKVAKELLKTIESSQKQASFTGDPICR
ncbi:MAG: hypothetical protein RBT75_10725 [Anaerolineae bacterium]|jgi:hypothetical protein|nr:hypothetical protein [Anaerolineae bacterium]